MLVTNSLPRTFMFEDKGHEIKLSDPSENFSTEAVLIFYSQTYPLLTTAKIEGPEIIDDELRYRFVSTMGTKG